MKRPETVGGRKIFEVTVYHVTDAHGRDRFLTINSLTIKHLGGTDAFEAMLAAQYKTFELMGSTPIISCEANPYEVRMLDPLGARQLRVQIDERMAAYPNSSHRLEPWLPGAEESTPPPPPPIRTDHHQWRALSTLKEEVGNVSRDDVVFVFSDVDVGTVVKPEFVSIARTRGGAMVDELKEDFRLSTEKELNRWI